MRLVFTLLFVLAFTFSSFSQAGTLDPTFGNGGKTTIHVGDSYEQVFDMAVQPDGKVILVGNTTISSGPDAGLNSLIVRFLANGNLDPGFGNGGIILQNLSTADEGASDVVVQPDGKLLVSFSNFATGRVMLTRFLANGTPDPSFGINGSVFLGETNKGFYPSGLAIQNDGRILLSGEVVSGGIRDMFVARFQPQGSLDPSFGLGGVALAGFDMPNLGTTDMVLQADGRIVVLGQIRIGNIFKAIVARFLSGGSLDTTLDGDGKLIFPSGSTAIFANSIAVQPDNKFLVAGSTASLNIDFIINRFNPDGTPDVSFDGDGTVVTSLAPQLESFNSILVQPDGKILATGNSFIGNGNGVPDRSNTTLIRYLPNGSLDMSFDGDGIVYTDVATYDDLVTSVALWQNRIYVGGWMLSPLGQYVVAYQNDITVAATGIYTTNGGAAPTSAGTGDGYCFRLTEPQLYRSGSVWNNNPINLNQSFEITTRMYFGAADNGADGMAFVLQQAGSMATGTAGGGLGYADIPGASFIIEFDTYQNTASWYDMSDPSGDHLGFMSNGSANHNPTGGTVLQAPIMLPNIENGMWNDVVFRWNAVTKTMTVTLMGNTYTYTGDIVNTIFGGNSQVYFGFTASTGSPLQGVTPNEQSVCILSATSNLQGRAAMDPQLITRVQPNPTSGQFELQLNSDISGRAQITISNSNGVVIENRSVTINGTNQVLQFDLNRLQRGVYLVRVVTAKGTQTQKLIKQ